MLLGIQGAALFLFAAPTAVVRGFPLDDAWIHQVVARTFAQTGTLGFAKGQYGAAATSHLWAALLSINYLVVHADPYVFTLSLNVLLTLASAQLLLVALRRQAPPESIFGDLLATAFACAGGNFLWFAYSGMEASLVVFLALAAIVAYGQPGTRPGLSALVAGIFAGLLAVTRPECLVFGPMLAAATWVLPRKKKDLVFLLAPWLVLAGAWLVMNFVMTGNAIPPTLAGRRWLWQHGNLGLSRAVLLREFAYTLLLRLRNFTLGTSATPAFWALMGLCAYGLAHLWRTRSWTWRLVLVWGAMHLAIYALLLPTPGHGGRYQPFTPLLFLFGGAYGAVHLGEQLAWLTGARSKENRAYQLRRAFFVLASLSPWVGLTAVGLRDWRHDHACAVSHIRWTELGIGERINRLPPEAKVASFDIGGIGFASKRPIVDIGGLSDAATAHYMGEGRLWALLREQHIDYVVLPVSLREDMPDPMNFGRRLRLFDNPAIALELVDYRESPFWVWGPGINATWNSSQRQALYRVHDTGKDGLATPVPVTGNETLSLSDPGHMLSGTERDMLTYGLRRFAADGVPVALTLSGSDEDDPRPLPDTWQLRMGPAGVHAVAPSEKSTVPSDVARAAVSEMARGYIDVGDFGGAARLALYGLARAIQTKDPLFSPLMAPVSPPNSNGALDDFRRSIGGGIFIVVALACAMITLEERRRGHVPRLFQAIGRVAAAIRRRRLIPQHRAESVRE